MQVLSHAPPAVQRAHPSGQVALAQAANDRLAAIVKAQPERFAGFACLPTSDSRAAEMELERAVKELGLRGAMVHGLVDGVFLDDARFWPVFETAQSLDVPMYIHPGTPQQPVIDTYYADYLKDFPSLLTAGWGYTVETATHAIRLVLSGVFDAFPNLKIILGHLGESLPFSLWRIDDALSRPGNKSLAFRDCFREHFWITTSGNFSTPALMCSLSELGPDRVLFAIDYPFVANRRGTEWLETVALEPDVKANILGGSAQRLLGL